ncbi:hypothetical protein PTH_0447 [Pelotomaculum thermopropionicum SI]|uniref:AMP-binding enzyme C-terminal domain-containing protein n=1 Tax=Pelotomaculum thermopropionicum (strain DSM 13744 / JCM 10971 / SI) TaxID=370438 RepID=A5D563_PELTS|nr:hypothetical protein PTH_0447 [Pelotomaculum thermopropionicum SI]
MNAPGRFEMFYRQVEDVLFCCPKVAEAVVLAVGGLQQAEILKAYIVLREGEAATAEEIVRFCAGRLEEFLVPGAVEFRESLPKTPAGKVLRRVLLEEEKNRNR